MKKEKYVLFINNNNVQWYCEILLQFKLTVFYFNIFLNVIYSCDGKLCDADLVLKWHFLLLLMLKTVNHFEVTVNYYYYYYVLRKDALHSFKVKSI